MKTRVVLRGVPDGYSSYSFHWMHVVRGLGKLGYDVNTLPIDCDMREAGRVPRWAADTIVHKLQVEPWEMVIHCPSFGPAEKKDIIYNTMWESTRLPSQAVVNLNNTIGVIVPSEWQQSVFSAQGVDVPIYKVPMGCRTELFNYRPKKEKDYFLFGAAGRTMAGGCRKQIPDVVEAFQLAFDGRDDVKLQVKCYPEDPDIAVEDDRVELIKEFWEPERLAQWYEDLDCFVSASRGEGWGLMQHEAMAIGRPVIAVPFGGISEFYDETVGFPVDYKLVAGTNHYKDCGLYAEADFDSLIAQMQRVAEGGSEVEDKSLKASLRGAKYSWERSNETLESALKSMAVI